MKAHSLTIELPMYVQCNGRDIDHYQDLCELLLPNQSQLATFFLGRANSADHALIYSSTHVGRVLQEDSAVDVQYALFGLLEIVNAESIKDNKASVCFEHFMEEFGELFNNIWSPTVIQTLDPQEVFQSWEAQCCKDVLNKTLPPKKRSKNNKKM